MSINLFQIAIPIRSTVVRGLKPKDHYVLVKNGRVKRSVRPLSTKYGFDRGRPIDRYYIEKFLRENRKYIKGRCLEVGSDSYTRHFGGAKVKISDVIDVNKKNKRANIHADLRNLSGVISSGTYNCIILTHVLGDIDDFEAALKECERILAPGGVLLFTGACLNAVHDIKINFWRFTYASTKYIFRKHFSRRSLVIQTYGNALVGQAFWVGLSQEELDKSELEFNDPHYPIIVTAKATKRKVK